MTPVYRGRGAAVMLLPVLAAVLFGAAPFAAAQDAAARPNILFILLDNVGKDWFRCYGSQEDATPHIDRLARHGLRFRHFYVTPVCSTTRTMLLTGRYPFRTGWHTHHDAAIYGGGYLDWEREVTFARVLRDAGYATAIAGKWQINDLFDPAQRDALARHGFDEHCLWPEGPPGHPAHKQRYWDAYMLRDGRKIDTAGRFGPDVCAEYAIDFMRRRRNEPFLLYYSAILTHIPVTTTPHSPDDNAENTSPREKFAGMVRYADHLIGRMVGALDALGLWENTLVFVAADNGTDNGTDMGSPESLGGRIQGRVSDEGIYSLTERGINVPLLVWGPGWIREGRESDALVNAADVLPTLAELAGAAPPAGVTLDGCSFAPLVRGEPGDEFERPWTFTQYHTTRVVRDQRFKLYSDGRFYDLAADALERHDLARHAPSDLEPAAVRGRAALQDVLDGLPPDAEPPFVFRSISARKFRADADRVRRADWVRKDHRPPAELAAFFRPPPEHATGLGDFRSPLVFADGTPVRTASDWQRRREEIRRQWFAALGPWPPLIESPEVEVVETVRRSASDSRRDAARRDVVEHVTQHRVRLGVAPGGEQVEGFLLIPDGDGPFPAVLVVYYDAQTGAGLGAEHRDFGWQLARRGFVTLSIGKPNTGINLDDPDNVPGRRAPYYGPVGSPVTTQPLSALAYVAANCHTVLARRPEVFPDRIGIVGHSFGGKWALFAACLYDKFDCAVWSDPGIVFDERDRRRENPGGSVNYWDPWYLGFKLGRPAPDEPQYRFRRRLPSEGEPRTGSYRTLVERGHDLVELHALLAPRPLFVSGGTADRPERWPALNHSRAVCRLLGCDHRVAMANRESHAPTAQSNAQVYQFFEWWLKEEQD